ncbi:hypothetical protein LOAG_10686, partial [Loa loa]
VHAQIIGCIQRKFLKYYVHPNDTIRNGNEDIIDQTVYFKNATLGPWLFCWLDPATDFHCTKVNYFTTEEPYDVTTSVEFSVHRAFIFMISGTVLIILGSINAIICYLQEWPYHSLMCCSVLHIFSGMANFACIIVYMAAVSKEVGNKIYATSKIDDPLFHYSYGYSFIMLEISFLGNEFAALFSLVVYMAIHDERIFNKYYIRSLLARIDETDFMRKCHCRYHIKHRRSTRTVPEFLSNEYASTCKSIALTNAQKKAHITSKSDDDISRCNSFQN